MGVAAGRVLKERGLKGRRDKKAGRLRKAQTNYRWAGHHPRIPYLKKKKKGEKVTKLVKAGRSIAKKQSYT